MSLPLLLYYTFTAVQYSEISIFAAYFATLVCLKKNIYRFYRSNIENR